MKKFAVISGVVIAGIVLARGDSSALQEHVKTLTDAQALSATFTYQEIGSAPTSFKIDLAKPGMARIERGNELIVADGKTITVLDKAANSYYKKAQTDSEFSQFFSEDEMNLFAPFFNAKAFDSFTKVTDGGTKNRKGMTMNVVNAQVDKAGKKNATYYIDPATHLARQVEFTFTDGPTAIRMLVDTKDISLSNDSNASLFAFKAPDGSKEMSLEDMMSDKWYHDLGEAMAVAEKTHRKIFVDFMATWCGPCKKLAAEVFPTPEFKKLSKYFVFLQIDVDAQKDVAQKYGITAMPTQMILNAQGEQIGKTVGYADAPTFFNFINGYAK